MKTLTTQPPSSASKLSRKLLPALLVALFSLGALQSSGQAVTYTVGTGTSTYSQSAAIPAPLGYYYPNARMEYLYDTASLRAAGMPVGGGSYTIHQIAFNVSTLQSAMPAANFSVGVDGNPIANLSSTGFINGITNRATFGTGYPPSTGWNTINLSPAFVWNGTDNIIIEVCYTTGSSSVGPGNAGVTYHAATSKSIYASGTGAATYCGTPIGPTGTLSYRPNIRFTHLTPCTGQPTAGTLSPSGTVSTLCPGSTANIAASGYTNALGMTFKWMMATVATGPWIQVGPNSDRYTTPPLISNTYYHLTVTCTNSGLSDSTANTYFTFTAGYPVYASIPYFESFENWSNGCAVNDKISSNNWTNFPTTGDASWRREDQGSSASWYCPTCYSAAPAKDGLHSARHNSYVPTIGNEGSLNLYVNASATVGNKDLSFWWRMNYGSSANYDSLNVDMSTDGGQTFTNIGKLGNASGPYATWNFATYNIATTSPTTVIRFRARPLSTYHDDVYIDAVTITPPCTGAVAGTINSVVACKGRPFTLSLNGSSKAAGLSYLWQYRAAGTTAWSALPGGTVATPSATITADMDFRAIVTCTYAIPNVSDTTPVYHLTLAPFYYCYCLASANPTYVSYGYCEIGNVTIKTQPAGTILLNNGTALPVLSNPGASFTGYQNFQTTVPAPTLIRDSTYNISISQISGTNSYVTGTYGVAWLDRNRDGVFQASEIIINKSMPSSTASMTVNGNFTIGSFDAAGLTGLRALCQYYTPINPCGNTPYYGQFEDYLVKIEYQPCSGPVNPGTAWISDSVVCPGYTVDLFDTSYEKQHTNILRAWEVSTNGGASFSVIPGSFGKDTMANVAVTASSVYRLRVRCGPTGDTTYSNTVSVRAPEPVRCYPVAWAAPGGNSDSSDIGAFIIGNFVNPPASFPAGPHLLNPLAHRRRTDYTMLPPIELNADSTYRLAVYHTMPRGVHKDAMISVYMDFNNDLKYDEFSPGAPFTSELVMQGISVQDSFFLDTKIKIPDAVIPNVRTGLRVVLNNDLNPTGPGNSGAGVFGSGEVEDYIVIFRRAALSVNNSSLLQNLALYPNPTEGKFTVLSDAARSVAHLDVVVSTITGQQVLTRSFDNVGTHFTTSLDLSNQAKGIYFVEIRADGEKITKKLIVH